MSCSCSCLFSGKKSEKSEEDDEEEEDDEDFDSGDAALMTRADAGEDDDDYSFAEQREGVRMTASSAANITGETKNVHLEL